MPWQYTWVLWLLLLLHLLLCLIVYILIKIRILKSTSMIMVFVLFIPIFGFLCLIFLEFASRGDLEAKIEVGVEKLKINDEVYRSIIQDEDSTRNLVVPLQEALLMNDATVRRQLIMDILYSNVGEYVDVLMAAKSNDDSEVVHYATTAMVELQKDYEEELRQRRLDWEADEGDWLLLDAYVRTLERYVDSGLLNGNMLRGWQVILSDLLSRQMEEEQWTEEERLRLCQKKFEVDMDIQDYAAADAGVQLALERWPDQEEGYLMKIQLALAHKDISEIHRTISALEEGGIYLSPNARQALRFWKDEKVGEQAAR